MLKSHIQGMDALVFAVPFVIALVFATLTFFSEKA